MRWGLGICGLVLSWGLACSGGGGGGADVPGDPGAGPDVPGEVLGGCAVKEDCAPRPCQVALCKAGACEYRAGLEGTTCAPGDPCSAAEGVCEAGLCKASPKVCTVKPCQVGACDPATGECAWTPAEDGLACDDGDPCTGADRCVSGACVGDAAAECECRLDADCLSVLTDRCQGTPACDPGTHRCAYAPGTAVACDNTGRDPCDRYACDPQTGACVTAPRADGEACDLGDPCRLEGKCKARACDAPPKCPDTACAVRSCDAGECVLVKTLNEGLPCDDGNACTLGDTCLAGTCDGTPDACDDGNGCTVDSCVPATGCAHDPVPRDGVPCDDGLACTSGDACTGGQCQGTPGIESCNGSDDDCDGLTDEQDAQGCSPFWQDADGDGYGGGESRCLCAAAGLFVVSVGGDCDDANPKVSPSVAEACDGIDDDCDGTTDEVDANGCLTWYLDVDGDGYAAVEAPGKCLCAPAGQYGASDRSDCNDADAAIHPGVVDTCEGVDNDCDGETDEDLRWARCGLGACDHLEEVCVAGVPHECDPLKGATPEACNGADDDCDGSTDNGLPDEACGTGECARVVPACLDGAPNPCLPGPPAAESCNGKDDDCDGETDEAGAGGCAVYRLDHDGDGWGTAETRCLCAPAGEFTAVLGPECYDDDADVYPGHNACGLDADCDGRLKDPGEACDDGNAAAWDGCGSCTVGEFVVNAFTEGDQVDPVAAFHLDGTGGFVVAWAGPGCADVLCINQDSGVYLRRFADDGAPLSGDVHVNSYTAGVQDQPSISARADRSFVVAWRSDPGQVRLQRFDEGGAKVGAEIRADVAEGASRPSVAALEDGRVFVAWAVSSGPAAVLGRFFAPDGAPLAPPFAVNTTAVGSQADPRVSASADGTLAAVFSTLSPVSGPGVRGQRFGPGGAVLGSEFALSAGTGSVLDLPDVSAPFFGGLVAAWREGGQVVRLRRFQADGTAVAAEITVNPVPSVVGRPSVNAAGPGAAVAWRAVQATGGVSARRFDAAGISSAELAVSTARVAAGDPRVSMAMDGRFLVVWPAKDLDGSGWGIAARRFAADGTSLYR